MWIILNMGYFIFEIPTMHRRLLKSEMGQWYRRDIILPVIIVASIALVTREAMPADVSRWVSLIWVLVTLVLSFVASAWATGFLNSRLLKVKRL